MEERSEKKFAVLIDSDNISQKYCEYIMSEIAEYGIATYKRIYGDWSNPHSNWKDVLLKYSITPIQQYGYTVGKNATDSALIIDAMDILYTGHVDGFCIVSSDSDFTKLAARLRESGMMVIGMGEKKTPEPLRVACEKFIFLDVLAQSDVDEEKDEERDEDAIRNISVIYEIIQKIITENDGKGKKTGIGEIGSRLVKSYSDFDVRNYGYSKLSTFLENVPNVKLERHNNSYYAYINEEDVTLEAIEKAIITILQTKNKAMNKGELGSKLNEVYPNFKPQNYGYNKFTKLLSCFKSVKVKGQNVTLAK